MAVKVGLLSQVHLLLNIIDRGTAPEQPVEWAYSLTMARRIFTNFNFFKNKIREF